MGREPKTRKSDGRVTIVESPAAGRKRSPRRQEPTQKTSHGITKKAVTLSAQEIYQEAPIPKEKHKAYKDKQTVSVAGIFKKAQKAKSGRTIKKYQRAKEPTPEIDLVGDLHDAIDQARTNISAGATATFDTVRTSLVSRLETIHNEEQAFLQHASETAASLCNPLLQEQIVTESRQDGKRVVESIEIGQRVAAFKILVENEEEKLLQAWKAWDEVQTEYIRLGIEVFGAEAFGEIDVGDHGYKKEMEDLAQEHKASIETLDQEINDLKEEVLQTMTESEKNLDSMIWKEQQKILASFMF